VGPTQSSPRRARPHLVKSDGTRDKIPIEFNRAIKASSTLTLRHTNTQILSVTPTHQHTNTQLTLATIMKI
jgi:hypothetical protein